MCHLQAWTLGTVHRDLFYSILYRPINKKEMQILRQREVPSQMLGQVCNHITTIRDSKNDITF